MADLFLIPYVREVWRRLRQQTSTARPMAIFGAGQHTRWLLDVTGDLPAPSIAAIIDDHPKSADIAGIPICRPAKIDQAALAFVLASSDQWEERMVARCRELWGSRVAIVRLYEGLPPGPYDKAPDRQTVRRIAAQPRARRDRTFDADTLHIALICGHPRSREAKLAAALRHVGCRVTLLHRAEPAFDASRCFDAAIAYTHPWQALRLACEIGADVHHVMVSSDYRTAEVFVAERAAPVVVDSYDLIAGMYTDAFLAARPQLASQIEGERVCLEAADGVVSRSGELAYLRDELGYAIRRMVSVPDGCWNRLAPAAGASGGRRQRDESLHVVYAGNLASGASDRDPFGDFGCWIPLAETLTRSGIDFHLYPSVPPGAFESDARLAPYRELGEREPRFHLHRPVAADGLIAELARYEVGVFVYNELAFPTVRPGVITRAKMRCCATNKFYDYVDAGLAIAHNALPGTGLSDFAADHRVGLNLGAAMPAEWPGLLRGADIGSLKAAARSARARLDIRHAGPRLVGFYREILAESETPVCGIGAADHEENDHAGIGQGNRPALL